MIWVRVPPSGWHVEITTPLPWDDRVTGQRHTATLPRTRCGVWAPDHLERTTTRPDDTCRRCERSTTL